MTIASGGLQAYPAGPPGKSAYQLAVDNGYTGTVVQWLASLQGQPGVNGAPGAPGAAGPSAATQVQLVNTTSANVASGTTYVGVTVISGSGTTITLPSASTYARGASIRIVDESGNCSATLPITINAAGSDTIAGQTAAQIANGYQRITFESNGTNLWTTP